MFLLKITEWVWLVLDSFYLETKRATRTCHFAMQLHVCDESKLHFDQYNEL